MSRTISNFEREYHENQILIDEIDHVLAENTIPFIEEDHYLDVPSPVPPKRKGKGASSSRMLISESEEEEDEDEEGQDEERKKSYQRKNKYEKQAKQKDENDNSSLDFEQSIDSHDFSWFHNNSEYLKEKSQRIFQSHPFVTNYNLIKLNYPRTQDLPQFLRIQMRRLRILTTKKKIEPFSMEHKLMRVQSLANEATQFGFWDIDVLQTLRGLTEYAGKITDNKKPQLKKYSKNQPSLIKMATTTNNKQQTTTTNNNKQQQTTTNNKQQQTTNNNKQQQQ